MEYACNNMVFEDLPGNTACVRLKNVVGPARSAKVLTVPEKAGDKYVVQLGSACCSGLAIESINLPKRISEIGDCAFQSCKNLKSFTLPERCAHIGESAFYDCSALSNFFYNGICTHIRSYTFSGCISLKNFALPQNAVVDAYAFRNVVNLTVPQSVMRINKDAFNGCPIESITFLGSSTCGIIFKGFGRTLKRVVFKGAGALIGDNAFEGCINLERVEGDIKFVGKRGLARTKITSLSGNIESVGEEGLYGTNLTSVPRGLKRVDKGAFSHCNHIKSCDFSALKLIAIPEAMFAFSGLEQVNIGPAVTHIGKGAFDNCKSLKSVDLGGYSSSLKYIAADAFCDCPQLKSVRIPSGVTFIGKRAFTNMDDPLTPIDINFEERSGWSVRSDGTWVPRGNAIYLKPEDLGYSAAGSTYARYSGFEWRRS